VALVTVADLALFAQLTIPAGTPTTNAQKACDMADAMVKAYTGRGIEQATTTSTPVVVQRGRAPLPFTPVQSVASVTDDGAAVDYTVAADGALEVDLADDTTLLVTYTHGFATGDYRLNVAKSVAVRIAHRLWNNPQDATSYSSAGPQSQSYSTTPDLTRLLTMDERAMLGPCVRLDRIA
jgi:hypothetical protein